MDSNKRKHNCIDVDDDDDEILCNSQDTNKRTCIQKCVGNCDMEGIVMNDCELCMEKFIKNCTNLLKVYLLHKICSVQNLFLLKKFCQILNSEEKVIIFNYALNEETPLFICIKKNNVQMIKFLMQQHPTQITTCVKNISSFMLAIKKDSELYPEKSISIFNIDNDNNLVDLRNIKYQYLINITGNRLKILHILLLKLDDIINKLILSNEYLIPINITHKYFMQIVNIYSDTIIYAINNQNYNALHVILTTGSIYKIISSLESFQLPIFCAINKGDMNIIRMMIDNGTNFINKNLYYNKKTPIHILSQKGFYATLNYLINEKRATAQNDEELCEYVFSCIQGTNVNPLHIAAFYNNSKTLELLLSLPNAKKYNNRIKPCDKTPLIYAMINENIACIEVLLKQDETNLLIQDIYGNTPIVYAICQKKYDIIMLLLNALSKKISLAKNIEEYESYLIEKQKWLILTTVDTKRIKPIKIKSFSGYDEKIKIKLKLLLENINKIKEEIVKENVYNNTKPQIALYSDNFEHKSIMLEEYFDNAAELFGSELFMLKKIFGNETLYLPYYQNITAKDIDNMCNFGFFMHLAFLYNPIQIKLSNIFYKFLLDETITLDDIGFEEELIQRKKLLSYSKEEIDDLFLTMTVKSVNELGESVIFELIDNGANIAVTKDNVLEYLDRLLDFYVNGGNRYILLLAFKKGFLSITNITTLKKFTFKEIMHITTKKIELIPIEQLKMIIKISHYETNEPIVFQWLWEYLEKLSPDQQRRFIKFISGNNILRLSDIREMANNNQRIIFQYAKTIHNELPWSNCNMHTLFVPSYKSKKILFEKFDMALK